MRIVIVEDEVKTLFGIKSLLEGIGKEYEIVGTAQSGEEGIEIISKQRPDLIITDIQMPGMTGLDMIRMISEKEIVCKYIILSGHADFEYAREALQLGSFDYLLKPITEETLLRTLEKVKNAIVNINKEESFNVLSSEELFEKVVFNKNEPDNSYSKEFFKRFEEKKERSILFIKSETGWVSREMILLKEIIKHHLAGKEYYCCFLDNNKKGWIFITDTLYKEVQNRIQRIYSEGKKKVHTEVFYAITNFNQISKIYEEMEQTEVIIQWNLSFKESTIITKEIIQNRRCEDFVYPTNIEKEIINKISSKNTGSIEENIMEFVNYIMAKNYRYTDIREALICLTVAILYSIRKASYGIYQEIGHLNILEWVKSRISMASYVTVMMNIIKEFERYQNSIHDSSNPIIGKVLQIIEKEYNKEINLEELAERLHITPEYLSSLFIKEIGVRFTSYCTQKRIEAAKLMLQNKNNKIYEVAEANGYSDVRYFCKVFKKYTGISPSDYMHFGQ